MNLIAFSRSRNCVNTQYAALSGAMVFAMVCHRLGYSFVLMLYIPVNNFSVMLGQVSVFPGCTSTKQRIKCLAQGQNTVTTPALGLELATF